MRNAGNAQESMRTLPSGPAKPALSTASTACFCMPAGTGEQSTLDAVQLRQRSAPAPPTRLCMHARNGEESTLLNSTRYYCAYIGGPAAGQEVQGEEAAAALAILEGGGGGLKPGGKGLQFSDKDEHMYFWFPLLAGLSELTFDPRPDIRYSALEVPNPMKPF